MISPHPRGLRCRIRRRKSQEQVLCTVRFPTILSLSLSCKISDVRLNSMTRNIRIVPDFPSISAIPVQPLHKYCDILILPGGGPGAKTFSTTKAVLDLINDFAKEGKWVAAICAGTTALVSAGVKAKVTSHPSVMEQIKGEGWEYSEERVVVDGKVITSRG